MKLKQLSLGALIFLATVFVCPLFAQDDNIGDFNIDLVNEDVTNAILADTVPPTPLFGTGASPMREPENYALVLLRVVGYLVVVTVLIFGVAWGVRKFGVAGIPKGGGGNNMDIIETLYIGQNRGTTLMRVGDAVYLIGHTQENIVLLEKIEGEKAIELIASSKSGSTIVSFKDAFNNFMGKMKKS